MPGMKVSIEQIEAALEKHLGFQTSASKALGINQSTLCRRIQRSRRLQQKIREIDEKHLDFSESQLLKNIKKGKEASIFFHLKCKAKKRGYVEKVIVQEEQATPKKYDQEISDEDANDMYRDFMND